MSPPRVLHFSALVCVVSIKQVIQSYQYSNVKADATLKKTVSSGSYYVVWSFLDPFCNVWLVSNAVVETTDVGVPYRCGLVQSDHVGEQVVDGQVRIRHLHNTIESWPNIVIRTLLCVSVLSGL